MAEQTVVTQPGQAEAPAKAQQPRQLVRFTFYKLDAQWYLLPGETRQQGKQELLDIFADFERHSLIRSYGLYGLRSDC
ncbi:MAG: chlorite dismutase, partial [Chloroflexi bacterium]